MLVGARMSAERLRGTLLTGVALLGGGLLGGHGRLEPRARARCRRGRRARRRAGERRRVPLLHPLRARGPGGPLRGRVLLGPCDRLHRRAAVGRPADRRHGLVPRAARNGSARTRRARTAGAARSGAARARGPPPSSRLALRSDGSAAVIPVFRWTRVTAVAAETLRHVDDLVLVDDGAPPEIAALSRSGGARSTRRGRAPGREPRQGLGGGGRHRGRAGAGARRGDRARLRRAASARPDPGLRRRGRPRRRRDRRSPSAVARCLFVRRVATHVSSWALSLVVPPAPAGHPERDAALPRRRAARGAAAARAATRPRRAT